MQRMERDPVLIAQKYDVDLQHHGEQIEYRASIQVKREPSPSGWYDFTLFNGWNVSDVKVNGHPVVWERSGDWIRIHFPAPTSVSYDEISVRVHGHGGAKSQVTSNSFYLAETFPWLPVPGKHTVATVFPSKYNRILLPEEVEYTVHISSAPRYPVYSNLARTGTDTFSGRAQGVMLASSLLLEASDQHFTVLTPPDRQDQLLALLPEFRKKSAEMARWLGVQAPELPSTIITAPSYSTWYTEVIDVGRDVLALNSNTASRQPHQLFDEHALFYALYWNGVIPNSYEEEIHIDGMLLYALIREIYERKIYKGGTSLLHDYANPDPDFAPSNSDTIDLDILYQRAYMLAQWLQHAKPGEAEKLIRNVYHSLLHNQERTYRWEKAMKEVAQHAATAPAAS
ncbi:uridine phosphorylase [Paenibacillus popilliae ATCC 14706]|uniref:Uridine phosphorylase n=2 Tax=Paenibacillus popilliae TaxID=78057 RepID=M9L927_PAEPP|nr:uridine phosphorylase [Paenibacillus popilliae ATCC 14706]